MCFAEQLQSAHERILADPVSVRELKVPGAVCTFAERPIVRMYVQEKQQTHNKRLQVTNNVMQVTMHVKLHALKADGFTVSVAPDTVTRLRGR